MDTAQLLQQPRQHYADGPRYGYQRSQDRYREVGGGAIVDATSMGIGRDPDALVQISRGSGVHIVMGAGFYVDAVHPEDMDERNVEDLALEITSGALLKASMIAAYKRA